MDSALVESGTKTARFRRRFILDSARVSLGASAGFVAASWVGGLDLPDVQNPEIRTCAESMLFLC
jgi:hypothetical protein